MRDSLPPGAARFLLPIIIMTVAAIPATAACVTPTDGMIITENTVLCPGTYELPNGITIAADDITLQGPGCTITGPDSGYGIYASGRSGVTVTYLTTRGFWHGMHFDDCDDFTITQCNAWDTHELPEGEIFLNIFDGPNGSYAHAMWLRYCDRATVTYNDVEDQQNGISLFDCTDAIVSFNDCSNNTGWGIHLYNVDDSTISNNTADYCTRDYHGWSGADAASLLMVMETDNNQVLNNSLVGGGDGVFLAGATHSLQKRPNNYNYFSGNDCSDSPNNGFEGTFSQYNVYDNNISHNCNYGYWLGYARLNEIRNNQARGCNTAGIAIEHGNGHIIEDNSFSFNGRGIWLWTDPDTSLVGAYPECRDSHTYTIQNNILRHNSYGILCEASGTNRASYGYTIVGNEIDENTNGIRFVATDDSEIRENYCRENNTGVSFDAASDGSTIYNNFFRNAVNAVATADNDWDINRTAGTNLLGKPYLGGNFWDDYAGVDNTGDWLGDTETPHTCGGRIAGGDRRPMLWDDPDCNLNGVPDATEPDCNTNGIPDDCDIDTGSSADCNTNGLPDECDIAAGTSADCNMNGIPDSCDLVAGTSLDCNRNGIPDECDITSGASLDCNGNGIPDSCDIAEGSSTDCNVNGVPDNCDLASGAPDCNGNGIPDECDIAIWPPLLYSSYSATLGWQEIKFSGTALNLGDNGVGEITMPFTNDVFPEPIVQVSNNGALGFGTATEISPINGAIPDPYAFGGNQALFPYWDDLDSDTGNVFHATLGFSPNRTLVIEWFMRPHYPGDTNTNDGDEVTFQVQIFEQPINGVYAQFIYLDTDFMDVRENHGASATIGYQAGEDSGHQWSRNEDGAVHAGTILSLVTQLPIDTDENGNGIPDDCEDLVVCHGDANCDDNVNFRDIDYFVAGMNDNLDGWVAMFDEPGQIDCLFDNLDCNGDGSINFRDIDPFVDTMNTTCP